MVVDNSLTDSSLNSNRVLVSETLMMMKEHIVDAYGQIKYTMGNGCSGGSIQQNTASSIYPGLLDGIQPSCDYPDSITTGLEVIDCVLLVNAYAGPAWTGLMSGLTQAQINAKKTAINGHLDHRGCQSWNNAFGFNNKPGNYVPTLVINNDTGALAPVGAPRNNCRLPAALVYDPVTQPDRHALRRCRSGHLGLGQHRRRWAGSQRALQTGDNVGVQYGLKALLGRRDHGRGVRHAEREDRRRRRRLQRHRGAFARRPAGAGHRLPCRHRVQRQQPRQAADHRLARLGRAGHPLHLAHLLAARTASTTPTAATTATR